jgi:hypothetical protein
LPAKKLPGVLIIPNDALSALAVGLAVSRSFTPSSFWHDETTTEMSNMHKMNHLVNRILFIGKLMVKANNKNSKNFIDTNKLLNI